MSVFARRHGGIMFPRDVCGPQRNEYSICAPINELHAALDESVKSCPTAAINSPVFRAELERLMITKFSYFLVIFLCDSQ